VNVRARHVVLAMPVVLTVVIALGIGALVVVQDQRQSVQVSTAEETGQDYLADVARFRTSIVSEIEKSEEFDPGRLSTIIDRAVARPPTLGDAPEYGQEHSTAYAEALQTRATVLRPFERLSATLKQADAALAFITAARKALSLRATDYIGFGFITSSAPVRSSLIPAFVQARDELAAVPVPKGQEELARTVRDAIQYVIDQATVLADRLERRQNFSFGYRDRFQAAADAVSGYATQVKGDVTEAVTAVTAAD
jgi:hypothetical protein